MQHIDPALLSDTSRSAYRAAFERGYRALKFEAELERQFAAFYTDEHLVRIRLAGFVAIFMFALFVVIDYTTLPAGVAAWTAGIRVLVIIPTFFVTLWISYRTQWRAALSTAAFLASFITGLGTVAVIGSALRLGYQIRYEGILLVALFIYLIVCLQWRRALFANASTLVAFIGMEMLYQSDHQARLYEIVFMCAANAVGAYGAYFLEYSTRTNFLVHALLNELAERDGLTGLFNRRTLNIHLDRIWRQAHRDKDVRVALAMIDIDYFKRYNDRYGHAQGDVALKTVADIIGGQARRPLDLAARYGGEEFVVVWYNPASSELANLGQQLADAVTALELEHAASELGHVSISVGIATMQPVSQYSNADLLRLADRALYEAKDAGRNRVVVLNGNEATAGRPKFGAAG